MSGKCDNMIRLMKADMEDIAAGVRVSKKCLSNRKCARAARSAAASARE